jgi:hypothetical protein
MIHLFVRHEVTNYEEFCIAYDKFWRDSNAYGAPVRTVYQSIDNPNDITVEHIFKSLDDARTLVARTLVASDDLAQAMTDAGILGTPQIWLTEKR